MRRPKRSPALVLGWRYCSSLRCSPQSWDCIRRRRTSIMGPSGGKTCSTATCSRCHCSSPSSALRSPFSVPRASDLPLCCSHHGLHVYTKSVCSMIKISLQMSVKNIRVRSQSVVDTRHGAYTNSGGAGFAEEGEEGVSRPEKRYSR